MVELTSEEMDALKILVVEKDVEPPNDSVLTDEQHMDVWFLCDLGFAKHVDIPGNDEEWVWRPTEEGLKFYEEHK